MIQVTTALEASIFLKFTFAVLVACSLGKPVMSAPSEHARLIVDHVVTDEVLEQLRTPIAQALADLYAEHLAVHGVRISDRARFAGMLPKEMTQHDLDEFRAGIAQTCLGRFPEPDLRAAALEMRALPQGSAHYTGSALDKVTMVLAVCVVMQAAQVGHEIRARADLPPDRYGPLIADILVTDGIASFPNRIVRDSVISSLRSAQR